MHSSKKVFQVNPRHKKRQEAEWATYAIFQTSLVLHSFRCSGVDVYCDGAFTWLNRCVIWWIIVSAGASGC